MTRVAIVLALGVALGSCAGQSRSVDYSRIDMQKNEIQALSMQIREWRAEAKLAGVEPPTWLIQRYRRMPFSTLREQLCAPPEEPVEECTDVCDLAENICENAEKICEIAAELPGDTWARDKCTSAKASCKEAKDRCCSCETKNGNE